MTRSLSQFIQSRLVRVVLESRGDPADIRLHIQQDGSGYMQSLSRMVDRLFGEASAQLAGELEADKRQQFREAIEDSLFCRRVKDAVLEDLYGERLAPPLDIRPGILTADDPFYPAPVSASAGDTPVHAFCVECLPNICNELYPLMIDSYVCDLSRHWRQRRCPIGVHADWLDDELRATRCIYYLPEPDALIEASLAEPLSIRSVHFLAVSPNFHRLWSERFEQRKIMQANPYAIAARADDKYGCIQDWKTDGVPTPEASFVKRGEILSDAPIHTLLKERFELLFRDDVDEEIVLVAQPNRGTEGRGAEAYAGPRDWSMFSERRPELFVHLRNLAREDDILLRRGIRNVLLCDPHTGKDVCFDLRANVTCGRMESGFLMAAAPGAVIASPGRGGHLLEWKPGIEWRLRVAGHSDSISWDGNLWNDIRQVAEAAAVRFSECLIAGVDIRLEWRNGSIVPHVLDINPRPAGLAHSRYFDSREPGVTQYLWDVLPE